MTGYRKLLYEKYHSTQENRGSAEDSKAQFNQQVFYFTKELLPLFPPDRDLEILDVGCGNGSLLQVLQNAGYANLHGIDLSEEQVTIARKMGLKNVKCAQVTEYLHENHNKFDVICLIDVIEHFTKDELSALLGLIKNALKNGGMVLFRTPNMDAPLNAVFAYGDFTHECLLNKNSALQLMQSLGYNQVEVLPSMIYAEGFLKEILRKFLWFCVKIQMKLWLFASGRTWENVVFTPNLIIRANK